MERIINKLKKHNLNFKIEKNTINVILGFGLILKIIFLDDNSVKISGHLTRWNFLTGMINLSLKQTIIYVNIWLAIFLIIQVYYESNFVEYPYMPFIFLLWFVVWIFYYLTTYYSFQTILYRWLDS